MTQTNLPSYKYQVGGSLPTNAPTYVKRKADDELYQALKNGEFCYVLNSRQMGKSSLRVQTMQRLQGEGFACVEIDITNIGTANVTPEEWYAGIIDSRHLAAGSIINLGGLTRSVKVVIVPKNTVIQYGSAA